LQEFYLIFKAEIGEIRTGGKGNATLGSVYPPNLRESKALGGNLPLSAISNVKDGYHDN